MIPVSLTYALATAAADNNICASQTPLAAGNLTINGAAASGGVATLDAQRQVLLTFAADETGHNFTLYGTNSSGTSISEVIAGTTAGTVVSTLDYKTVTRVAISAAATGAIKVGTNGVGASPWKMTNYHVAPENLGIGITVVGTVNYTFQITTDLDPCGVTTNTPITPANAFAHATIAAQTTSQYGSQTTPITAWRIKINSGTGSVTANVVESGLVG